MNNKIATDETMPKMADATRLRTQQLLRFSGGYSIWFYSLAYFVLLLGLLALPEGKKQWGWGSATVAWAVCSVLVIAGTVIMSVITSIRKKKLMHAETYRRSNERSIIIIFIFYMISFVISSYILEQIAPGFLKNHVSNNSLIFLSFLGILNFYSFLKTHLREELIASIVCFGISVVSFALPFHNNFLVALSIGAFIQTLLGGIFWIRWQRFNKQISDENREEKAS